MRIAMIGAGAMGSVFGARFARAGADVVLFDADRTHVEAIEVGGFIVEAPDGSATLRVPATTHVEKIGKADLAVVLVDSNAARTPRKSPSACSARTAAGTDTPERYRQCRDTERGAWRPAE